MDKKTITIGILLLLLVVLFIQMRRYSNELVDMKVRQANLEVCLNLVREIDKDDRHAEINSIEECVNFYLSTPTQTIIDYYN